MEQIELETYRKGRDLALRRLSCREQSVLELHSYLKQKGFSHEVCERVLKELMDQGYVSDERYTRMMARDQVRKGKGPRYVSEKLRQKGIQMEPGAVRTLLIEVDGFDELDAARKIVERRYPNVTQDRAEANRAFQALVRRGFSFDIARKVVFG